MALKILYKFCSIHNVKISEGFFFSSLQTKKQTNKQTNKRNMNKCFLYHLPLPFYHCHLLFISVFSCLRNEEAFTKSHKSFSRDKSFIFWSVLVICNLIARRGSSSWLKLRNLKIDLMRELIWSKMLFFQASKTQTVARRHIWRKKCLKKFFGLLFRMS